MTPILMKERSLILTPLIMPTEYEFKEIKRKEKIKRKKDKEKMKPKEKTRQVKL